MHSVVLGKVTENNYYVDTKTKTIVDDIGEEKIVYIGKPTLIQSPRIKEWKEICRFKGESKYNRNYYQYEFVPSYCLNISENESVKIEKEIFRADLNELHLHSDKVLEEIDIDKEEIEQEHKIHIKAFNKMMIESNKSMKDYCDLHGLDYENADCETVFSLVFPEKECEIKDGRMICKSEPVLHKYNYDYALYNGNEALCTAIDSRYITATTTDNIDGKISACVTSIG